MFTVCPKCTLTLALTTGDLRMGQGYVRCGRCANVFNALLTLSEEPVEDGGSAPARRQVDPAAADPLHESLSEPTPETSASQSHGRRAAEAATPPAPHLATEQSSDGGIENESSYADGTGTFETIVLEGDAITQIEEYVPEASVDSEIAALTERLGAATHESYSPRAQLRENAPARDVPFEQDSASPESAPIEVGGSDFLHSAASAAGQPRWPWILGITLLLLLLLSQGIHHWRERIAAVPYWNGPLNRAYAALGLPLDPRWNLAAYDVRQQGAASDPQDNQIIRVRLSLANHAERAQPVPLLRLTLLDRYGKRLARRDLTPSEYWPPGQPPRAFLAHDERVDSEIAVRDPAAASASFELDVCLRSGAGILRCAADLTPPTTPAFGTGTP
jgi:predicted Zn finger-like uncharacterized protein